MQETFMRETTDRELVANSKDGDNGAVSELFRRHYRTSMNVARRILRSEEESEDAVQAAYLAAFRHLGTFRGEASFKTWITQIVANSCLMVMREPWRRRTRVHFEDLEEFPGYNALASPSPSPEKSAWRREITVAHEQAVSGLPKHLRDVYSLYAFSEMTLAEVANSLGLSLPATKSRVFRARTALRSRLRPVWSGESIAGMQPEQQVS